VVEFVIQHWPIFLSFSLGTCIGWIGGASMVLWKVRGMMDLVEKHEDRHDLIFPNDQDSDKWRDYP
jgi:hypothetical protein